MGDKYVQVQAHSEAWVGDWSPANSLAAFRLALSSLLISLFFTFSACSSFISFAQVATSFVAFLGCFLYLSKKPCKAAMETSGSQSKMLEANLLA